MLSQQKFYPKDRVARILKECIDISMKKIVPTRQKQIPNIKATSRKFSSHTHGAATKNRFIKSQRCIALIAQQSLYGPELNEYAKKKLRLVNRVVFWLTD